LLGPSLLCFTNSTRQHLQPQPVYLVEGERAEQIDSALDHHRDLLEFLEDFGGRPRGQGRVGGAPVGDYRLPRPHGAGLARLVADCDHEVEIDAPELFTSLAPGVAGVYVIDLS
jgi:hypothetical protein